MSLAGAHPSIDAVATLAPATSPLNQSGVPTTIDKPLLILQGTTDLIVTYEDNAEPFFDMSGDPRHLITIDNGSHGGFLTSAPLIEQSLPPGVGIDSALCQGLLPTLGDDPIAQACNLCNPPATATQISAGRQHDLTRAGVLSFFNAYLKCRALSLAYLKHVYDVENSELAATYSGGFGEGLEACLQQ